MPRHSITVTAYHADGTICPSGHRPHHRRCAPHRGMYRAGSLPCRLQLQAVDQRPSSTKSYAAELGRRHRSDQLPAKSAPLSKGPAASRQLLRFDAAD